MQDTLYRLGEWVAPGNPVVVLLLSGYLFPFRGMPGCGQDVGAVLPPAHFLRVVRGILRKGTGLVEIAPGLWPMALFLVVMLAVGIKRCRQTLDQTP